MTEPTWLPIPGSDGYEASSDGRIRSIPRTVYRKNGTTQTFKSRELVPWPVRGYPSIKLGHYGRKTYVHTLVCETFHGPRPTPTHEVRHLNGDKTDNRAENLAWGTRSENTQDSIRLGTFTGLQKTTCPQGHPYDTVIVKGHSRRRRCSICDRQKSRAAGVRYRERQRARESIAVAQVRAAAGQPAPVSGHRKEEA